MFLIFLFFLFIIISCMYSVKHAKDVEKARLDIAEKYIQEQLQQQMQQQIFIDEKIKEFNEDLISIPKQEVKLTQKRKLSKNPLYTMGEYNFTTIRRNTNYMNFEKYIVIDTETTGLHAKNDELLEISMIKFEHHSPVSYMTTLIKPKVSIPDFITDINGISDEMVVNSPTVTEVTDSFNDFIKGYDIVGYNLEFDLKFLHVNGINFFEEKRKFYDVLALSRKKFPYLKLYDYKLNTVAEEIGIYRNDAHRALSDAYATALIFGHILDTTIDINVLKEYYNIQ